MGGVRLLLGIIMVITLQQIRNNKFKRGDCYNTTFEYEDHKLTFIGMNFEDEPPVFETILDFLHYCSDTEQNDKNEIISLYFHYCNDYGEPMKKDSLFNLIGEWDNERKCYLFPRIESCEEYIPKKKQTILSLLSQKTQW